MTVRHLVVVLLAGAALLLGQGCSGNDDAVPGLETDDPTYRQGKQLQKQGRNQEALLAFERVIEARGDRASPESHFEAGLIYLHHIKDPIAAIYHFRKYREFPPPNSALLAQVRELETTARREFARTLPARPEENQSVRLGTTQEAERLRRENEELRAELATLRGGGATPVNRALRSPAATQQGSGLISLQPLTLNSPISAPVAPAPPQENPLVRAPATPAGTQAAVPSAIGRQPAQKAAKQGGGRTHTVQPRESLWSIARAYYGSSANNAKVQALEDANRELFPNGGVSLKPGMVLRIP
ncbi:MAG: LysM peptidoglycan-binding domain-containing protein [Opitutus sp.]